MEKNSDILAILNPAAAKGTGAGKLEYVRQCFASHGAFPDFVSTGGIGQGESIARKGVESGYRTIVAIGGDGTVNEVASGIMASLKDVKLGIVPIGRGNDFAWSAGIPRDIDGAVNLILSGKAEPVDVGFLQGGSFMNGRYFLNGVGFGFEPMVNFQATSYTTVGGALSYLAAFLHILIELPEPYLLHLNIDGEEVRIRTQQLSVSNGKRMGGSFIMAPCAVINDGKLDVIFPEKIYRRSEIPSVAWKFLRGTQLKKKGFRHMLASEVRVISDREDMQVHMDGEVVSHGCSYVRISIIKGGLKLFYNPASK